MSSNIKMAELNFIVLKINDVDVRHLPQDEAVRMFLNASDSIIIEVRRKIDVTSHQTDNSLDDVASKLEHLNIPFTPTSKPTRDSLKFNNLTKLESNAAIILTRTATTPLAENKLMLTLNPVVDSRIRLSIATQTEADYFELHHQHLVKETTNEMVAQEQNLFEQCLVPEIDVEEITLRKSDSNERLGLTVCYSGCSTNGSGNNNGVLPGADDYDTCTEVYVSDIQPDSIAGRDGRLRQGDQILQINGKGIKNKEETESLIAENYNAVTLLVSRYLYADEDDFNVPSMADIDVVDEDDDEDDYEEEFYDENNLNYENCFVTNDYINVVDQFDEVLLVQAAQQSAICATDRSVDIHMPTMTALKTCPPTRVTSDISNSTLSAMEACIKSNYSVRGADQQSVHLNCEENEHLKKNIQHIVFKPTLELTAPVNIKSDIADTAKVDYETEHIYETIPEDSESEPFYCTPYESSAYVTNIGSSSFAPMDDMQLQQQKQRVAQWLGIKPNILATTIATTAPRLSMRSSSGCGRSLTQYEASSMFTRNNNDTVHSAITTATSGSSSSGGFGGDSSCVIGDNVNSIIQCQNEEHDNSSSAYNTGGSNNSVTPLILLLNQNVQDATLTCRLNEDQLLPASSRGIKVKRLQTPKEKITTSKNSSVPSNTSNSTGLGIQIQQPINEVKAPETLMRMLTTAVTADIQQQQQFSPKTMYTNEANLHQTILLQQHLFRQALTNQQVKHQQAIQCPQFTAPNLSQYHFVSSQQQVSAAHITAARPNATVVVANQNPNEESMVWKVKRRQDGTRYIVRRPVRNRLLRDRSVRLNTKRLRNDNTTTEEETISEVKTGRYWSKEERKKHMERARERRQHQPTQQLDTNDTFSYTVRVSDRNCSKPQQQNHTSTQLEQRQANIRLHRYNSTKTMFQQHCQLQFNTGAVPQQPLHNKPFTVHTNVSADLSSKALLLSSKSISSNLHICSPVDATPSESGVTSTTAAATTTEATTLPASIGDAITDSIGQPPQSVNDTNKVNHLLSVTTV